MFSGPTIVIPDFKALIYMVLEKAFFQLQTFKICLDTRFHRALIMHGKRWRPLKQYLHLFSNLFLLWAPWHTVLTTKDLEEILKLVEAEINDAFVSSSFVEDDPSSVCTLIFF